MLRLSKLTDYAVVVLTRLDDAADGGVLTAPGLAGATGLAEPTVAKVLKILAHAGLVEGRRGALGGYRLTRPLADMPLIEVI
ncbi:MAG: Rrf2 family transcriptional regulator, partial [Alphaproteobacteria bacterium]